MSALASYRRFYWPIQILGWLIYGLIQFGQFGSFQGFSATIAIISGFDAIAHLSLSHAFRVSSKRLDWIHLSLRELSARVFGSVIVMAILAKMLVALFMWWPMGIFDYAPFNTRALVIGIVWSAIYFSLWSLLYFTFHYFRNFQQAQIDKWKLEAAAKDAELIALKAQINPHFLFNCLNNIRALVLEDSDKARDAITQLSQLLRYSIQYTESQTVTVQEEIDIVRQYLSLESIHMESRLSYAIDIEETTTEIKIPPMCIQLLVENAIKHGLSESPKGGHISIESKLSNGQLSLVVSNSGQLKERAHESSGIGLKNARERLALIFGDESKLHIENATPDTVVATISIPLK